MKHSTPWFLNCSISEEIWVNNNSYFYKHPLHYRELNYKNLFILHSSLLYPSVIPAHYIYSLFLQ